MWQITCFCNLVKLMYVDHNIKGVEIKDTATCVLHVFCFEVGQNCSVMSQTKEGTLSLRVIFDMLCSPQRFFHKNR